VKTRRFWPRPRRGSTTSSRKSLSFSSRARGPREVEQPLDLRRLLVEEGREPEQLALVGELVRVQLPGLEPALDAHGRARRRGGLLPAQALEPELERARDRRDAGGGELAVGGHHEADRPAPGPRPLADGVAVAQVALELAVEGEGGRRGLDVDPVRVVAAEDEVARRVGDPRLRVAQHDPADDLRVRLQRPELVPQVGPGELQEGREAVGLALVGGGGQQQERGRERAQRLGQPVALGAGARLAAAEAVRLVEDHEVPGAGRPQQVPVRLALGEVERDDDLLVQPPVRGVVDDEVAPVDLELLVELEPHLVLPLPDQPRRADDQDAPALALLAQHVEDQPDLDRLAEADVVRDQPVHVVGADDLVGEVGLVRQRVDVEPGQGARRLVPGLERVGQHAQPEALGVVGEGAHHALGEALLDGLDPLERLERQPPRGAALEELDENLVAARERARRLHRPDAQGAGAAPGRHVFHDEARPEGGAQLAGRAPPLPARRPLEVDERPPGLLAPLADPALAPLRVPGPAALDGDERVSRRWPRHHQSLPFVGRSL
jgi:hypothetical protein